MQPGKVISTTIAMLARHAAADTPATGRIPSSAHSRKQRGRSKKELYSAQLTG